MATISEDDRSTVHLVGAIRTFACIVIYAFFIQYLYSIFSFINQKLLNIHSNVIFPSRFIILTIISFTSSIILVVTNLSISQYVAVGSTFPCFLTCVPQLWTKTKEIKQDTKNACIVYNFNTIET